jgi:hypothetical protein
VIAACSAALFLPLLYPLLTGRVFTRDDIAALHLPFRYLYQEALLRGESFLWTPAYHSGFYLHGEGEAGMSHPLHLLLYRLLPLGIAFNVEIVSTYVALLAGTGFLLLRLGLSSEAAWFGAMVFTFCGFNLFNLMHVNHIAVVAHIPWLLLGTYVLLTTADRNGRALAFGGVALAGGSELLVGNPQYIWLTLVALAFMVLCLLYAGIRLSRLSLLLGASVLGILIGAAQLLPTIDFASQSTRMLWSADEALTFSLSPLNLVQLWSPFAFQFRIHAPAAEAFIVHEFIVYNGAFCTMAFSWLALRWRQQARRGLLIALFALAAVAFVLAMGRYGVVYAWLAQLPGLRNFRAPARHLVLFQLALSGIAAVAFEDLIGVVRRGEKIDARRLWPLAVPVAVSIVATAVAGMLSQSAWSASRGLSFSGLMRAAPWTILLSGMAALIAMAGRGARWAVPILIVFVACDQGFWGYSYVYRWGPIRSIPDLVASAAAPAEARRGDLIAPLVVGGAGNVAVLRGLRLTPGYSGLVPSSTLDPGDVLSQQISGVAWRETETGAWVRVPGSMPRARLVSVAQPSADVKADVRRIDISRVALVDRSLDGLSGSSGSVRADAPATVRVLDDRPGSLALETTASARQLLVLTERFHRGWRVAQDGDERETLRVYGDYLGCLVDPGRHRLTLTFAPASARYGLRVTLAGLALTLVATMLLAPVSTQRRSGEPQDARI